MVAEAYLEGYGADILGLDIFGDFIEGEDCEAGDEAADHLAQVPAHPRAT